MWSLALAPCWARLSSGAKSSSECLIDHAPLEKKVVDRRVPICGILHVMSRITDKAFFRSGHKLARNLRSIPSHVTQIARQPFHRAENEECQLVSFLGCEGITEAGTNQWRE